MQIGKIITINFLVFLALLFFLEVSARVLGLSNLMGTSKNFVMDGPKGYHVLKPNSVGCRLLMCMEYKKWNGKLF